MCIYILYITQPAAIEKLVTTDQKPAASGVTEPQKDPEKESAGVKTVGKSRKKTVRNSNVAKSRAKTVSNETKQHLVFYLTNIFCI